MRGGKSEKFFGEGRKWISDEMKHEKLSTLVISAEALRAFLVLEKTFGLVFSFIQTL